MRQTKQLLGQRIREVRRKAELSQDQLSEMIGIDAKHLSRIELGKSYPYVETLDAIAEALKVELKDLFDFGHLEVETIDKKQIEDMLEDLSQDKLRLLFRIVKCIVK